MIKKYFTILFFLMSNFFYSQESNLEKIIRLEQKLTQEAFLDTILSLSFSDKTSNMDLFLELAKKANTIANTIKDTLKIAKTNEALGLAYHFKNKFDKAIENTIKAANYYYLLENYPKYGDCYVSLGWRINRRDLKQGIFYMLKGIKILEAQPQKTSFLRIGAYNNYGVLKQRNQEKDSALYYHKKSYDLCIKHNDSLGMPYAMVEMAMIYTDYNQLTKAKNLLDDALKIRLKIDDTYGIADSYENLGNHYFKRKDYIKAIEVFEKALNMANTYSFNYMKKNITEKLYQSYFNRNNYKKAFEFLKFNKAIVDSTNSVQIESKIQQLEIQFETAEKEKELLETRTEKAETELQLSKIRGWIFVLIAIFCIAVVLFFAINQRIKRKNQEAILAEKEKGFKAIIDAQEEERSNIARELHDGVVQQIGSVILKSRSLFSKNNLIDNKESQQLLTRLENSNQEIRNISHQMMPRALKELGIIAALQDLLSGTLRLAEIKFNFEHFNIKERLPKKIEVTIYRITQELIQNILKHSKATEVNLQLFKNKGHLLLIVEDNGVGFSKDKNKKGIGLLNIASRLNMVNGTVHFDSNPKNGTLVTIKIPV